MRCYEHACDTQYCFRFSDGRLGRRVRRLLERPRNGTQKIGLVYFGPDESADNCMKGLFDHLKEQGIEERVNLEVRQSRAEGEFANIPLLIQNYDSSDVDVIVVLTTPVLTAAASMARSKPVVFSFMQAHLRPA